MKVKTRFSCSGVITDSDDAVRDVSALSSEYGGNSLSSTFVSKAVAKQSPNLATRLQRPMSLAIQGTMDNNTYELSSFWAPSAWPTSVLRTCSDHMSMPNKGDSQGRTGYEADLGSIGMVAR